MYKQLFCHRSVIQKIIDCPMNIEGVSYCLIGDVPCIVCSVYHPTPAYHV